MKNYFSLLILTSALFAQNVVTESDSLNPITLEGVEVYSSLRQVNEGDLAASAIIFNDELGLRLAAQECDCDFTTSGNTVFETEIMKFIDSENRLLRPKNLFETAPGKGFGIYETKKNLRGGVNVFFFECFHIV